MGTIGTRSAHALAAAVLATCLGAVATSAAEAAPSSQGSTSSNGHAANAAANGTGNGAVNGHATHGKQASAPQANGQGRGRAVGRTHAGASHGAAQRGASAAAPGARTASSSHTGTPSAAAEGDPPGNNGTVKIITPGTGDGIPNNTPHPGCTVGVEWYGFDEGPDVVSTVSFAMQAPTADATVTVAGGPLSVPVGGDAASGAGTATGLDARETYTLSFTGTPHPKQGFHVKLTVSTPRSNGSDRKTKVFWVAPCDAATPAQSFHASSAAPPAGASSTPAPPAALAGPPIRLTLAHASGPGTGTFVNVSAPYVPATPSSSPGVPTAVDAGEGGLLKRATLSLAGALLALGGGLIALTAARRRRSA
ncbi:hypothetical protein [Nocardioides sp. Kera G14]|uniref:hypothetical protein n=1 Tax=Nocardioides sp. Kera G14 TaxID=2884264 RepID=UPI001D1194FD|nr:hypothetical protein [Nocardioides sp. Kera G14]UDY24693.1 hypothetical protein LH076_05155 [Nocardioides sp. Kera G14]